VHIQVVAPPAELKVSASEREREVTSELDISQLCRRNHCVRNPKSVKSERCTSSCDVDVLRRGEVFLYLRGTVCVQCSPKEENLSSQRDWGGGGGYREGRTWVDWANSIRYLQLIDGGLDERSHISKITVRFLK